MSRLVCLLAFLPAILAVVINGSDLKKAPKTPEEFLSYMQARGFMQIDEIIDDNLCISFKFYITHDSTQKCLRHRCTDNVVVSEFDCNLWNLVKKNPEKLWSKSLTRHVRNHISQSKSTPTRSKEDVKESVIESYSIKPDTCTTFTKIRSVKGTIECWRKNCKDDFSVRVQCKLYDGVKPTSRHFIFKKRRHHGKI